MNMFHITDIEPIKKRSKNKNIAVLARFDGSKNARELSSLTFLG